MNMLIILMSVLWSLLLHETPLFESVREMRSDYYIINLLLQALSCPMCLSAHIYWISYLIINSSIIGVLLCPIPYWLNYIFVKYILPIKI